MTNAQKAVKLILIDLCDRSGLQNAWDDIDEETQIEISNEWARIVDAAIKASPSED